jgi:hypothetical protein
MKIALLNKGYNIEEHVFEVKFPGEVEVMPPIGTLVSEETVVASGSSYKVKETINLLQFFGKLTKADLDEGIACFEGEVVKLGDVLFSRTVFGVGKKEVKATAEGLISLAEISRGKILILDTRQKVSLKAGVKGKITGIYPEGIVHITSPAYSLEMFRVFGKKVGGLVSILSKEDFEVKKKVLTVKKDLSFRIALLNSTINSDIYKALLVAGAVAVVTPGVDSEFFKSIDKLKRVNITLVEGWGRIVLPKVMNDYMNVLEDQYVEIIPGGAKTYYGRLVASVLPEKAKTDDKLLRIEPKIGELVQIFEPPYWAKEGEIIDILDKDEVISVRLKSGETLIVPPESVYKPIL